jgi:hypothetical protein
MQAHLPNVLLATESGLGRGHIANLAHMVKHMGKDFNYFAGLYRTNHCEELQSLGVTTFQSLGLFFATAPDGSIIPEGHATWADYIFAIGLAREDVLRRNLVYWMNQMTLRNIRILVAEYAPTAILAAKILNAEGWDITVMTVGTAYSLPPKELESFPVILPDFTHSVRKEADVLQMINRVLADFKTPPLPRIAAIYDVDVTVALTFSFLDPYRKWRNPKDICPPRLNLNFDPSEASGDEVFIYFSSTEFDEPEVVQAFCDLPLPRRAYLPNASPADKAKLAESGVILEETPVSAQDMARRSKLFVHAGQPGTITTSAMIGRPQIGLPQHLEQTFHARRAGQQGILELLERPNRTAQNIINLVQRSYHSASMQARAWAFAQDLAIEMQGLGPTLSQRLEPILAAVKNRPAAERAAFER